MSYKVLSDRNIWSGIMFTSIGHRGNAVSGEIDEFNKNVMNIKNHLKSLT